MNLCNKVTDKQVHTFNKGIVTLLIFIYLQLLKTHNSLKRNQLKTKLKFIKTKGVFVETCNCWFDCHSFDEFFK